MMRNIDLGFTGTLDGTQTHKMGYLEGLFGPAYKIVRTDETH